MTKPDPGTLDAMIQALGEDSDDESWASLVASRDSSADWARAERMRAETDAFAEFVLGAPALAEVLASARRRPPATTSPPFLVVGDPAWVTLRAAPGGARRIPLAWGRAIPMTLALGEKVALATTVPTWVIASAAAPRLLQPGQRWRLDHGDCPLLLLALDNAPSGKPFVDAARHATAIAGVLVFEAPPEERGET